MKRRWFFVSGRKHDSLRFTLGAALDVMAEQAALIEQQQADLRLANGTNESLRLEVAALRRQNLALDAQLDHMTRVNQALDAGITTTSTQERT